MSSTGMGPVPISWSELNGWLQCTETDLSLWERRMIKSMSEEYVQELLQATAKDRPAPYQVVTENVDREAVQSNLLSILRRAGKREEPSDNEVEKELE